MAAGKLLMTHKISLKVSTPGGQVQNSNRTSGFVRSEYQVGQNGGKSKAFCEDFSGTGMYICNNFLSVRGKTLTYFCQLFLITSFGLTDLILQMPVSTKCTS